LAFPIGHWLAYLCKDELVKGREWFRRLMVWSFVLALVGGFFFNASIGLAFVFILIVAAVSYYKTTREVSVPFFDNILPISDPKVLLPERNKTS
jgi:hypothetical protein